MAFSGIGWGGSRVETMYEFPFQPQVGGFKSTSFIEDNCEPTV